MNKTVIAFIAFGVIIFIGILFLGVDSLKCTPPCI